MELSVLKNATSSRLDSSLLSNDNSFVVTGEDNVNGEECLGEVGKYEFRFKTHHILKGKGGLKTYKCDICGGKYKHAFSLKRHYLRTHINYEYLSLNDISNCNICVQQTTLKKVPEKKFVTVGSTAIENETENKCKNYSICMPDLYRCHVCAEFFNELPDLKNHVGNHPEQPSHKRFCCVDCKMTFSHRQNLVRHLSVHSGVKPYACRHCGKRFPTATNQKRHERIHDGIKPYKCCHCCSLFTQSGDLKKHIRKQHNKYFHSCTFCVKYFSSAEFLQKHIQTHGNELNATVRHLKQKSLKSIMRKKAKKRVALEGKLTCYVCTVCRKRFSTQSLLNHHKSAHACKITKTQQVNGSSLLSNKCNDDGFQNVPSSEADFYADIAYNISENLLNYLDGKINGDNCAYNIGVEQEHAGVGDENVPGNLSWRLYNFPPDFDMNCRSHSNDSEKSSYANGFDLSITRVSEDLPCEVADSDVMFPTELMNCLSLSSVTSSNSSKLEVIDGVLDLSLPSKCIDKVNSEADDRVKCSLQLPKLFVCYACGESVSTLEDMENHKINNHPNVQCNHLEIECPKDISLDVFKHNCSSTGLLKSCMVPPSLISVEKLTCTKCQQTFEVSADLHSHMLECGGYTDKSPRKNKHKRHKSQKKSVSRGMKRKLEVGIAIKKGHDKDATIPVINQVDTEGSIPKSSYLCSWCQKCFHNHSSYDRHNKICVQKNADKSKEINKDVRLQHSCPYCARSFTYLASLKKHVLDCLTYSSNKTKKAKIRSRISSAGQKPQLESSDSCSSNEMSVDQLETTEMLFEASTEDSSISGAKGVQEDVDNITVKVEKSESCNDSEEEILKILRQYKYIESEREEKDSEINVKEEKRDQQTYSCPHCKRTYTYMANFKKHVKDACPLRKDATTNDNTKLNEENSPTLKIEAIEADVISLNNEEKSSGNSDILSHSNMKENSTTDIIVSKQKQVECSRLKPMDCPVCHKIFFSYVKLLQHQLLHKLNSNESDEAFDPEDIDATECENGFPNMKVKEKLLQRKNVILKNIMKHKGGWPKGKSRKGYIPKHKRMKLKKRIKSEEDLKTSAPKNVCKLRKAKPASKVKSTKIKKDKLKSVISPNERKASGLHVSLPKDGDCKEQQHQSNN